MTETPSESKSIVNRLMEYALQQTPLAVVLFVLLGMISYSGHYALTITIPSHFAEIRAGYEKQAATYERVQESDRAAHSREIEKITTSFDRAVDAMTKAINELERRKGA